MLSKRSRNDTATGVPRPKKKRTSYGLDVKMDIINRRKNGERVIDISRTLNIPETTVHTILKKTSDLEARAKSWLRHSEVKITRMRSDVMETMERRLATWIGDLYQHTPVSLALVQEKALSLYEDIRKEMGEEDMAKAKDFSASKGWFNRFQKRYAFKSVKIQGESTSWDVEGGESYPVELNKIIQEGGYSPKQIFNADETGLYWKRMPSGTYISQQEKTTPGFQASKERVTLLLGGNASGDKKLKPLLVFRSDNPPALKNVAKSSLPVIWKSHRKAWITCELFRDWFVDYFVPTTRKYCEEENLPFKVVLILDNASAHCIDFVSLCSNVKIVFLPPCSTARMQPMDQGVSNVFKATYLRYVFKKLLDETDTSDENSVHSFWKEYSIFDCVKLIDQAWNDISPRLLNVCWKNVYPDAVAAVEQNVSVDQIQAEIVNLARDAGFDEVDEKDVQELLDSHALPLTNEELAELDKQTLDEEDDESISEDTKEKGLTIDGLQGAFAKANEVINYFINNDPIYDRAAKFERGLKDLLACYRTILNEKIRSGKPSSFDSVFLRPTPITKNEPQLSPSGTQL